MAGAGGGGFIFVLTKEPNMVDEVKAVIKSMKVLFCLQAKLQCFVIFVLISLFLFQRIFYSLYRIQQAASTYRLVVTEVHN